MLHIIKKGYTKSSLVLFVSLILVTGALVQISLIGFFENNDHTLMKISPIYAEDGGDGGDGGGDGGDGGGDGGDGGGDGGDGGGDGDDGGGDGDDGGGDGDDGGGDGDDGGGDGGDGGGDGGDGGNTPDFFGSNNKNDDGDDGGDDGDDNGSNTPNGGSNNANFFSSPSGDSNDGTADSTPDQQGESPTTESPTTEPPTTEPPTTEPPTTEPPTTEPPTTEPPTTEPPNPFQLKIKYEFNFKIIDRTTNKIIVKDYNNDIEKQIIVVTDKIKCPTQSDSVGLTGKISPKGIRLLADFDPCRIVDGGVTLNIPNNPNLKLAVVYIDKNGNNHAGTLINPVKIQTISKNQGLFTVELDDTMKGINPVTGQTTTLTKINGLALYNNGDKPIQFKSGNIAALTAVFTK